MHNGRWSHYAVVVALNQCIRIHCHSGRIQLPRRVKGRAHTHTTPTQSGSDIMQGIATAVLFPLNDFISGSLIHHPAIISEPTIMHDFTISF